MSELVVTALERALLWHQGVARLRGERGALAALREARRRGLELELLGREWPDTTRSRAMALTWVDDLASDEAILRELARVAWEAAARYWRVLREMPAWRRDQMLSGGDLLGGPPTPEQSAAVDKLAEIHGRGEVKRALISFAFHCNRPDLNGDVIEPEAMRRAIEEYRKR